MLQRCTGLSVAGNAVPLQAHNRLSDRYSVWHLYPDLIAEEYRIGAAMPLNVTEVPPSVVG